MSNKDIFNKLNQRLKETNDEIFDSAIQEIAFLRYQLENKDKEIDKLKESLCCYAREELGTFDFESDNEAIKYFLSFADSNRKPKKRWVHSDPLRALASNNLP